MGYGLWGLKEPHTAEVDLTGTHNPMTSVLVQKGRLDTGSIQFSCSVVSNSL